MDISEVVCGYLGWKLGQAGRDDGHNDHEGQAVIYHDEGMRDLLPLGGALVKCLLWPVIKRTHG